MKYSKKFLIAVLATATLCVGFTACVGEKQLDYSSSLSTETSDNFFSEIIEEQSSENTHEHVWSEKLNNDATCTVVGEKLYTCSCGESYAKITQPLGHTIEENICTRCEIEFKPSEGLEYELSLEGDYYSIIGIGECTDSDLVIPITYKGLPVVKIADGAFSDCHNLKSVLIPDSVISIGSSFEWCIQLNSVVIGNSVIDIGERAFYQCTRLTNIVIGNSVTNIGRMAFEHCFSLQYLFIPDSVKVIEDAAFTRCGMIYVELSNSIIKISENAFSYCDNLQNLIIPDSVEHIEYQAFYMCNNLKSVIIGDSVTTIGEDAFARAHNLTSVVIGKSVISIEEAAFSECIKLKEIVIPDSVISIGNYAFSSCYELESVIISQSVTSIGTLIFYWCENLTSITFNGTMKEWDAIEKGYNWKLYAPVTDVICLDGVVAL